MVCIRGALPRKAAYDGKLEGVAAVSKVCMFWRQRVREGGDGRLRGR